jgi:hypothetical protein
MRLAVELSTFASTRASLPVSLTSAFTCAAVIWTRTDPFAPLTRTFASRLDTGWTVN